MNTEIQHDKATAVEQHMLAILDIAHAEDTTDSMRRWIADELRGLAGDISAGPLVPREIFLLHTAYARRVAYYQASEATALRDAAHHRKVTGQPFVPVRRKSGRIDWRYPAGHARGTATLTFTKRAP